MSRRPAGPTAEEARGRRGGIGRSSSPAAEAVSDALRRQSGPFLGARRRIAALDLVATGALAVVAAAGPQDRHRHHPWLPLVLAGKVLMDTAWALRLTAEQVSKHRAVCFWCLTAATAQLLSLPHALPEARSALSSLRR